VRPRQWTSWPVCETSTLPGFQVRLRAKNYGELFVRGPDGIELTAQGVAMARELAARTTTATRSAPGRTTGAVADTKSETGAGGPETRASRVAASDAWTFPLDMARFLRVGAVGDLLRDGLPRESRLSLPGCYAVLVPAAFAFDVLPADQVRANRNVVAPWAADRLRDKWVAGTSVVYVGLAGTSLRSRLRQLLRHADGKTNDRGPHKGGEILWQLRGHRDFVVVAAPVAGEETPRGVEAALLTAFQARHGKLPFANRRG
jgi:hypothetical protein